MQNKKGHFHLHIRAVPALAFIVAVATAVGYTVWSKSYNYDDAYYPYQGSKAQKSLVDISDWKAYRNEELGFALEYPSEFTAAFNITSKTLQLTPVAKSKDFAGMTLSIQDNPQSLSMTNWWKTSSNYKSNFLVEEVPGGGIKIYSSDKRVFDSYVFLGRDKAVYQFYWSTLAEKVADQILYSFNFFTPKDTVSEWKTYSSGQHGFSVKYPEDVLVTVQPDAVVKFTQKGAATNTPPVVLIHSMEVSSVSQQWLNDVLPNYVLVPEKPVLDGKIVSTAAGRGEYKNHTLYMIPKDSGTMALVEIANSDLGKKILASFKLTK
ncbi:MAG: hypothetical protein A3C85_00470 [Candidatus Doudnabacteria bacterium RIFCSPHIGHO2_02_FULL_48_21]|uniref:Uncharacterized protein n=1 Tax=Candidatus Doudnabacteria bacterium RIFCSPLOWO2_02_FULL_48_13 TaxID=1817845 RepID=A0A1F5QCR8_9BACT|nr:MAG: hypothetical protein A3K05_01070 [Candidatus Doudnabacteria bacterium RIFCSPHIGHO2_01_48_18]OGE79189.1 MAG: hypothetical protein A2668_00420 [Candidatus Doudnabacteria bacterium RIFCSPHIGHO2_01_FULL_48_180]OGE91821.1 MAG: hypothetical protein A3F44_00980 [Candidatus Doudnabacteria bacterium RIFCSPHIGHO2_12_FULL_47_25]OGE93671.1 MAG: hypothetical protein A3C85_00470 [Candidatus Doudnabacteria bacterium RIFCSPHIGHO2_02_FULL_48_21]OGE97952.1 MAG: hypothetical protein A3A83_00655 [Candidatu